MTKGMRFLLLPVLLTVAILLSSCAPRYKDEFISQAKGKGWNEAQQHLGYRASFRIFLMERDSSGEYVILFQRLSKAQVMERFGRFLQDFNNILDPQNEEYRQYLDFFSLRDELEHQERVYNAVYENLRRAKLADDFAKLTGTSSYYGADAWRVEGYNIKQIFGEDFSGLFRSEYIEAAKRDGKLREIEHIIWFADQQLAEKRPNPNNPADANDFIWLARRQGVELVNYKVLNPGERPFDSSGNFIEGTRLELVVDTKGKEVRINRESQPALRIFMERGGSGVMVLDTDLENKDIGFGIPDVVETITVGSANSIITGSSNILARMFEVKEKHKRVYPVFPPIRLQIESVSGEIEFWEAATESAGWKIPFTYKNKQGDNYNVKLKVEREKLPDGSLGNHRTIKYLEKEWISGTSRYQGSRGNVVERYKMKPPFDSKVMEVQVLHTESTQKIAVVLPDGSERKGLVVPGPNIFVQDEPFAILYTDGQKRYMIVDEDGDGKFEKRREFAVPKEYKTGDYSASNEEVESGSLVAHQK